MSLEEKETDAANFMKVELSEHLEQNLRVTALLNDFQDLWDSNDHFNMSLCLKVELCLGWNSDSAFYTGVLSLGTVRIRCLVIW